MTEEEIIYLLNTWMDRYIANPEKFETEFQVVVGHLAERTLGKDHTYGVKGLQYMQFLLDERSK